MGGYGGVELVALVPYADLMNHAGDKANARWDWDSSSGHFVVAAAVDLAAGQELTIDYSSHNAGKPPEEQTPPWYFGLYYGFLEAIPGPTQQKCVLARL